MNIAIYPRKSKFSPTSESIANQVAMCREYCDRCFDDPHYLVYDEDEGFSGKSTNRPAYTQMIEDMRAGKFQVLCCYRLDRISRNVRDFAELLDDLQRHNIAFVSVRNNFDTSTPFGRAMVYISSALAQMERETLAERVKDNLYEMARSGRWLGGVTPLGFVAKAQEVHRDDKKRKLLMLSPVEEELAQVRDLFDHFLRLGSVTKLLQYCLEHRIIHPPTAATPLYTATQNLLASSLPADTIEQRLKYARLHAGLSGEALASLMGINKDSYWKMEARCHSMSCQHFLSFCRATACDPSFVLYGPFFPPIVPLMGSTIGARLAFFRASTGLTLRAFNVKCGFAARNSSVSAWEKGRYLPQLSSLLAIASAFGINAVSFFP